ncbi:MAG: hypothetical protein CMN76_10780 [Spirochaetaceae bacterium]|nr:hypothetical protein [Spirochaetaceae bacterium]|tara:strand:+ start:29078 stop:29524 length:447 start_codon:yes stop_codon:yes gene_type:complete
MRYTTATIINAPLKKVAPYVADPNHFKDWMEGLQSYESISGQPGKTGSKSRLVFQMGNRKIEMIETVEMNTLPDEYRVLYETDGVWNRVRNLFVGLPDGRTRYENDSEFRFKGFMAILSVFMKGSFKKQTLKYQEDFRKFVEKRAAQQ